MFYKNISNSVKTFYGVEFKPGEIKQVPGYINSIWMIVADATELKPTATSANPSLVKPKKPSEKTTVTPEVKPEEKVEDKSDDNKSSSSKD